MSEIINKHWTKDGTGITNFSKDQQQTYDAAIEAFESLSDNNKGLVIHNKGFGDHPSAQKIINSLHDLKGGRDLSVFWEIFRSIDTK